MSQAKSTFSKTFPDMNGKRVKAKSCASTCSIITIKCNVGELSERPQGIPMDTRSPNIHKTVPASPPRSSVLLQFPPSPRTFIILCVIIIVAITITNTMTSSSSSSSSSSSGSS